MRKFLSMLLAGSLAVQTTYGIRYRDRDRVRESGVVVPHPDMRFPIPTLVWGSQALALRAAAEHGKALEQIVRQAEEHEMLTAGPVPASRSSEVAGTGAPHTHGAPAEPEGVVLDPGSKLGRQILDAAEAGNDELLKRLGTEEAGPAEQRLYFYSIYMAAREALRENLQISAEQLALKISFAIKENEDEFILRHQSAGKVLVDGKIVDYNAALHETPLRELHLEVVQSMLGPFIAGMQEEMAWYLSNFEEVTRTAQEIYGAMSLSRITEVMWKAAWAMGEFKGNQAGAAKHNEINEARYRDPKSVVGAILDPAGPAAEVQKKYKPMSAEEAVAYLASKGLMHQQATVELLKLRNLHAGQRSFHIGAGSSLLPVAEALMGLNVTAIDANHSSVLLANEIDHYGIRDEIENRCGGKFSYTRNEFPDWQSDGEYDHVVATDLVPGLLLSRGLAQELAQLVHGDMSFLVSGPGESEAFISEFKEFVRTRVKDGWRLRIQAEPVSMQRAGTDWNAVLITVTSPAAGASSPAPGVSPPGKAGSDAGPAVTKDGPAMSFFGVYQGWRYSQEALRSLARWFVAALARVVRRLDREPVVAQTSIVGAPNFPFKEGARLSYAQLEEGIRKVTQQGFRLQVNWNSISGSEFSDDFVGDSHLEEALRKWRDIALPLFTRSPAQSLTFKVLEIFQNSFQADCAHLVLAVRPTEKALQLPTGQMVHEGDRISAAMLFELIRHYCYSTGGELELDLPKGERLSFEELDYERVLSLLEMYLRYKATARPVLTDEIPLSVKIIRIQPPTLDPRAPSTTVWEVQIGDIQPVRSDAELGFGKGGSGPSAAFISASLGMGDWIPFEATSATTRLHDRIRHPGPSHGLSVNDDSPPSLPAGPDGRLGMQARASGVAAIEKGKPPPNKPFAALERLMNRTRDLYSQLPTHFAKYLEALAGNDRRRFASHVAAVERKIRRIDRAVHRYGRVPDNILFRALDLIQIKDEGFSEEEMRAFREDEGWVLECLFPLEAREWYGKWGHYFERVRQPMGLYRMAGYQIGRAMQYNEAGQLTAERREFLFRSFQNTLASCLHGSGVVEYFEQTIYLGRAYSLPQTAFVNVHEIVELMLPNFNAGYSAASVEHIGPIDWVPTGFQFLSASRRGELEILEDAKDEVTKEEILVFRRAQGISWLATPRIQASEILQIVDEQIDVMRRRVALQGRDFVEGIREYLIGAAIGGLALTTARHIAIEWGRPLDERLIYNMAGRYMRGIALAGPHVGLENSLKSAAQEMKNLTIKFATDFFLPPAADSPSLAPAVPDPKEQDSGAGRGQQADPIKEELIALLGRASADAAQRALSDFPSGKDLDLLLGQPSLLGSYIEASLEAAETVLRTHRASRLVLEEIVHPFYQRASALLLVFRKVAETSALDIRLHDTRQQLNEQREQRKAVSAEMRNAA